MLTIGGVSHTLVGYAGSELFEQFLGVNGTVDVVVDAWLPYGHAGHLAPWTAGLDYVVAGTLCVRRVAQATGAGGARAHSLLLSR